MDLVYLEKPILILFPVILLAWQFLVYLLSKKKKFSFFVNALLIGVSTVGHAIAITVILMSGGTLSDALILVLLSGTFSLILSEKVGNASSKADKEEKN